MPWPHFEFLSFVLGVLNMAEINSFSAMFRTPSTKLRNSKCGQDKKKFFQPPTFGAENRRPRPKKLILAMLKTLSTRLRNSKCGQGKKKIVFNLLLSVPRIGD
jgi:hypothetical protein